MAYRMSTPNSSVKAGVRTTPPPSPVSAPRKPAAAAMTQISPVNSSAFTVRLKHIRWLVANVATGNVATGTTPGPAPQHGHRGGQPPRTDGRLRGAASADGVRRPGRNPIATANPDR